MFSVLAVEIDLVSLGSLIVSGLAIAGTALRMLWNAGQQIAPWAKEKAEKVIDAHNGLVTEMRDSVPAVKNTLASLDQTMIKLGETQEQQCKSLELLGEASARHEELHAQTGLKLDKLFEKLSANDMPTGK